MMHIQLYSMAVFVFIHSAICFRMSDIIMERKIMQSLQYCTGQSLFCYHPSLLLGVYRQKNEISLLRTSSSTSVALSTNPIDLDNKSIEDSKEDDELLDTVQFESEEQKNQVVGNLLADDEWMGLSMELTEVIRVAVIEDVKKNAREFLGKNDYKLGDFSKEIDSRVKDEVAKIRGKDEYELGDLVLAMDEMSKAFTEELTGKEYQPGDLSMELDKRIKKAVATYSGKDEYEFGDLSREVTRRVQTRVEEFTGKPYEFGDIVRSIEGRRKNMIKEFLGEEAAANYKFGDISKKLITSWTGKETYQFGDISKKLFNGLLGKRKRGDSNSLKD